MQKVNRSTLILSLLQMSTISPKQYERLYEAVVQYTHATFAWSHIYDDKNKSPEHIHIQVYMGTKFYRLLEVFVRERKQTDIIFNAWPPTIYRIYSCTISFELRISRRAIINFACEWFCAHTL